LIKIKNKCILSTFPNNLAASSQNWICVYIYTRANKY
jgi:hypothetical protein